MVQSWQTAVLMFFRCDMGCLGLFWGNWLILMNGIGCDDSQRLGLLWHSGGLSSGDIGPYGGWFLFHFTAVGYSLHGLHCAVPVMACYGHTLCYFHAVSFLDLLHGSCVVLLSSTPEQCS